MFEDQGFIMSLEIYDSQTALIFGNAYNWPSCLCNFLCICLSPSLQAVFSVLVDLFITVLGKTIEHIV